MTLESGPKNLERGEIEAPRVPQEMSGAEVHNDVARDDLQEAESDKEKDGAVKKKIEIPGVGEIEYTEKVIMFPEKIMQETGGVKGYIRKMVSWEELARYFEISPEEMQKIRKGTIYKDHTGVVLDDAKKESYENYQKIDGILPIALALTNDVFINKTFNHVVGGHQNYALKRDALMKDCMLGKFGDARSLGLGYFQNAKLYGCDLATNRILSYEELFEKAGIIKDLLIKYNEKSLSDEEKKIFLEKVFSTKNVYFQQNRGINLTVPGQLWSKTGRARNERYSDWGTCAIPSLRKIITVFRKWPDNPVLKKYCDKVLSIMKNQVRDESLVADIDPRKWRKGHGTNDFNQALSTLLSFDEKDYCRKVGTITGISNKGEHPQIPIVSNHPDIPELRWCHADYAAIPTKNGYNIIEMIT